MWFSRSFFFVRSQLDGGSVAWYFLVLVFAATRSQMALRPPLKKSLFPVQRVAIIVASREAAKSFFCFPLCIEMVQKMLGKKRKIGKCEKNMPTQHLKESPGRWTGNKIIFNGGLRSVLSDSEGKMLKLSMKKSKSQKISMDYSCHGRYKGIHIVFSLYVPVIS